MNLRNRYLSGGGRGAANIPITGTSIDFFVGGRAEGWGGVLNFPLLVFSMFSVLGGYF